MSFNKNNSRDDEHIISKYIKMISKLYDSEKFINNILINNKNTKKLSFLYSIKTGLNNGNQL